MRNEVLTDKTLFDALTNCYRSIVKRMESILE